MLGSNRLALADPMPVAAHAARSATAQAGDLLRRVLASIRSNSASAPRQPGKPSVQEVSEGLTCQCGCGLTVANCNHPTCGFAVPLRTEIEGMIKSGMSRSEIILSFRHKFGEKVLSAPTTEGFNILAWTAPFAALLCGAILILMELGRWRAAASGGENNAARLAEFSPRLKGMLEREIRERI
jgi:cytochrome c-type biogenesis protein CcmH